MDSLKKANVQSSTNVFVNEAETAKVQTETCLNEIKELKKTHQEALNNAEQNYNQTSDPNNINTTAEAATILRQAKAQLEAARLALQDIDSAIKIINDCKESATTEKTKIDDIRHSRNLNERLSHDKGELIAEAERRRTTAKTAAETAKKTLSNAKQTFDTPIAQLYALLDQVTKLQIAEDARRKDIENAQALQAQTAQLSTQLQQPLENKEVDEQIKLILDKVNVSQQAATTPLDQTQKIDAILEAMTDLSLAQKSMPIGKRMTLVTKALQAMQLQQEGQVSTLSEDDKNELSAKIHAQILTKLAQQHVQQIQLQQTSGEVANSAAMLTLHNLHAENQSGLASAQVIDNYTPTSTGQKPTMQ